MNMIRTLFLVTLLLVLAGVAVSQVEKAEPDRSGDSISALDFMAGNWEGEGWIQMGREKKTFTIRESFTRKLGGSLVVVEGIGKNVDPKTGQEKVIHSAYGVFFFDKETGKIGFRYFKEDGTGGQTIPEISKNKIVWGFIAEHSKTQVRFNEQIDEEGFWIANGEALPAAGNRWFPFFYMKLRRVE